MVHGLHQCSPRVQMDGWMQNTVHGLLNAVPWCSCLQGSPCRTHWMGTDASKHNGRRGCLQGSPRNLCDDPGAPGNGWNRGKCNQGLAGMGSRQRQADKAWQGKAGTGRCSTNRPAYEAGRPLVSFNEVRGGSAVVPAGLKAGSDLPYCLPPNLSPLPVSVHTHSFSL